jgi:hypothetical protein
VPAVMDPCDLTRMAPGYQKCCDNWQPAIHGAWKDQSMSEDYLGDQ